MSFKSMKPDNRQSGLPAWITISLWVFALICVFFMGVVMVQRTPYIRGTTDTNGISKNPGSQLAVQVESNPALPDSLAELKIDEPNSLNRKTDLTTNKPDRGNMEPVKYTIKAGDSIYGIAKKYGLEPESVLWANYDVLNDDVQNISIGDEIIIPPGDGIYYKWKESDVLQKVADKYRVEVKDILAYPANYLDITNPQIKPGDYLMLPGGYRETAVINPIVFDYSKGSGVKKSIVGPGGCSWDYQAYGSGSFVWPTANHTLTGNDFWSGHLGVDLGTVEGGPIYATDSGTVIYSGPISGGYGIMVMLDHGNGYQTLYAHLSSTSVGCGQSVSQGQVIGYGGSTGNSTGPHLHFEVRYAGGYVNPWNVL